jgi:glycosyltransferase involved in cell wall biosynthesis
LTALPLASVLMPAYNAERYVGEAIDTILGQTFRDFELLIVDDGSTDRTRQIVQQYERQDPRIRLLARAHAGIAATLNAGLAAARQDFIARMDADDRALPDRLDQQVAYLLGHPECVAVGGQALLIDPDGLSIGPFRVPLTHAEIDRAHLAGIGGGGILHAATTMRAAALLAIGGYRAEYEPAEDFDLFLRLAEVGQLANLPAIAHEYRMHPQAAGYARAQQQARRLLEALTDAYRRRGLPLDAIRLPELPPRRSLADFHREWAVNAARNGHCLTARKHASRALALDPTAPQTWRAVAHAFLPLSIAAVLGRLRARSRQILKIYRGA